MGDTDSTGSNGSIGVELLYWLGVACVTYFVSRAVLYTLRSRVRGSLGWLVIAHCIAGLSLFVLVFYLRVYDVTQALPYLPMQAFWLAIDWLRTMRLPARSGRRRTRMPTQFVGQIIAVLMVLGAIVYGAGTFFGFAYATTSYADIPIEGMRQDVLYAFGTPNQVRNGPDERFAVGDPLRARDWRYFSPSMIVQFDGETQRISSILCDAPKLPTQASCYSSLLGIGNSETDLTARLGNPTSVQVNSGIKIARYPEIGHDFALERFRIKSIRAYPDDNDRLAKLRRLIRYLIP